MEAESSEQEVVVPTPELVAAWTRTGRHIPGQLLPLWAAHWMVWGHDGPAVTKLAVLDGSDSWQAREALAEALHELGASIESLASAAKVAYNDLASGYLAGDLTEREVLGQVDDLVATSGFEMEMYDEPLGGLFSLSDSVDTGWGPTDEALRAQVRESCEAQLGRSRLETDFTLRDGTDPATVVAVYRGSLIAQRHRLTRLDIDVVSDEPWPDDVRWAVEAARRLMDERRRLRLFRWSSRTAGPTFRADVHDDGDFALAVALAPYTIGGTGLGERGQIIWSGNDTGTSAVFSLTETEVINVRSAIAAGGGDTGDLILLA